MTLHGHAHATWRQVYAMMGVSPSAYNARQLATATKADGARDSGERRATA